MSGDKEKQNVLSRKLILFCAIALCAAPLAGEKQ